jgi:hypothetical protein
MDCGMANWARGEVMDRRGSSCRRRVRGCRWLLGQTGDEHHRAGRAWDGFISLRRRELEVHRDGTTRTLQIWRCFYCMQQLHVADIVDVYLFFEHDDQSPPVELH